MDCDVALEDCEQTMDEPNLEVAVHLTGSVVLVNAVLPTLLWWLWRRPGDDIAKIMAFEDNKLYLYGWWAMWIGHLAYFGIPALLYPMTFFGVDGLDYMFVFWMNVILYSPIILYSLTAILLLAGAAQDQGTIITQTEVWSVTVGYWTLASITGFV